MSPLRAVANACRRRFPPGDGLAAPSLLVGAGHGTHAALLCARRARGGMAVVLMRPTLPLRCFDLCLIPDHDRPPTAARILSTRGPLTPLRPGVQIPGHTVILVGGNSRHFDWDEAALIEQIRAVVAAAPGACVIADSARTPASTRRALRALQVDGVEYVAHGEDGPDPLHARIAAAQFAWVSSDSLSMIFEALSAGAAVGILELPARTSDRVAAAVAALRRDRMVTVYSDWRAGMQLRAPQPVPDEAGRSAAWILRQLPRPMAAGAGR